jgi:hypothetical protein
MRGLLISVVINHDRHWFCFLHSRSNNTNQVFSQESYKSRRSWSAVLMVISLASECTVNHIIAINSGTRQHELVGCFLKARPVQINEDLPSGGSSVTWVQSRDDHSPLGDSIAQPERSCKELMLVCEYMYIDFTYDVLPKVALSPHKLVAYSAYVTQTHYCAIS